MDAFLNERRRKEMEMERLEIEAKYSDQAAKDTKQPLLPIDFALPPIFCNSSSSTENTSAIATAGVAVQIPPKAATTKPAINRSLKPTLITDNSTVSNVHNVDQLSTSFTASLTISKNKYGLRTIVSPSELSSKFMKCAEANTCKNIETCGVLFGKLANEEFVITHILIPHQIGAPDSCDTTREEDMWDFQDQYNGICLGWIHSHPSQTAFLSSVDLHTHYPYQCLMPESVAIVCSGKFNEVGYFMLTPDHGMNVIGNCRKIGFHPHPSNPALFEACDHVKVSSSQKVEIVDWRKK
ncbi:unnamed protein product [Clavelina lepadiformis]|uniref:MPN domain-containing protein n=1 Tax=Clavelina lepadiformis TaxID=159417 RepID=A0ABP0EZ12_CLALP